MSLKRPALQSPSLSASSRKEGRFSFSRHVDVLGQVKTKQEHLATLEHLQKILEKTKEQEVKYEIAAAISKLKAEIEELDRSADAMGNSVSASSLEPGNLDRARGPMTIRNPDAGVARHPFFYRVVEALCCEGSLQDMQKIMYKGTVYENISNEDFKSKLNVASIPHEKWSELAKRVGLFAETSLQRSSSLESREVYFSSGITFILNDFCRLEGLPFVFVHQCPCGAYDGSKEDKVDMTAFWSDGEDLPMKNLLGLIEVKKAMSPLAKWQLCGYLSQVSETSLMKSLARLSFGLTMDYTYIQLFGFLWKKNNEEQAGAPKCFLLEHSLLCKDHTIKSPNEYNGRFFQIYFLCLALLTDDDVRDREPDINFCPLVANVTKKHSKVFRSNDHKFAFKLFDYGIHRTGDREPNTDIVKIMHGGENAELLGEDKKCGVFVLKMPWFDGSHTPSSVEQVAKLCDKLQKLHDLDMKYCDVLCQNIVFGKDDTHLIDFDYAHLKNYPEHWNPDFTERHPHSLHGYKTNKLHDVYAAIAILCSFFTLKGSIGRLYDVFAEGPFQKDSHPSLRSNWKKASAKDVAEWIRENKDNLELLSSMFDPTSYQMPATGSPPEKK